MAAWRSTREWKIPCLSLRRVRLAKKLSTALSHEHEVGVKWKVERGGRSSQVLTLSFLCAASLGSIRNFVLWAIVMKKKGASYGNREGTIGPAVGEGRDPETVFTQDGLLDELKKGLSERVLNAELDAHLDAETADGKTNRHNGRSQKTVLTGTSKVTLDIPRDRVWHL